MNRQATRDQFFKTAEEWICDSYSLIVHYLATLEKGTVYIIDAAILIYPMPPENADNFAITAGNLLAGRNVFNSLTKVEILEILANTANGKLNVNGLQLRLHTDTDIDFYSEITPQNTGFSDLHLTAIGSQLTPASLAESLSVDNALRMTTPPFDGMADLCSWLQLNDARANGRAPSINFRINPPIDIIFDETKIHENTLQLTLSAHPQFDTSKVGLALREFPGRGIESRQQTGHLISWKEADAGPRSGVLSMKMINASSILAMLTVGGRTIRRRWFDDPDKAINTRYVATQLFDRDLKQLKNSLLETTDAVRFEKGIASLLYLLGFSSAMQVETQAPDILVTTPGGKIAIVECTTKISDFQNKLGKLVDRRNLLMKKLETTGHNIRVDAFLACGLPKVQIAVEDRQLIQHQVTLLSRDEINLAFDQLRTPIGPDEMLDQAAMRLSEKQNSSLAN